MAYSEFTLESVLSAFELEQIDAVGLFSQAETVAPSAHLTTALAKKAPLATTIGTEKAKSEMIVADVLVELREHFNVVLVSFRGLTSTLMWRAA